MLLAGSVGASVAVTCCTIVWLVLLAGVVDEVFVHGASLRGSDGVEGRLLAMVALLCVRAGCGGLAEVLADRASGRLRSTVRTGLVEHLFAVGPAGLSSERTGELAGTVGSGVEALHDYVTRFAPAAALALAGPLLVGAAVTWLDPWTTLILLFTGPMLVLLLVVIGGRTRALTRRRFDELGWLSSFYLDMIRGLATLKAFGRSREGAERIEGVSRRFGDTTMEVLRTAFQTSLVMEWAATAATALAAVEISFRMIEGGLSFGTGFAVLVLVPEFFVPFRRLAIEYHAGQSGRAAQERIDELLELTALSPRPALSPNRAQSPDPAPVAAGSSAAATGSSAAATGLDTPPRIELCGVTVRYPGADRPALDRLDLVIEPGETVALVGPSGAGKTTVARVLLRFVEPDAGTLRIDAATADAQDPAAWRRRIAWVPQHPTVIAGTVADNIRLGAPDAPIEAVHRAAAIARATTFVDALPDGFDTVLGDRGLRLSGGQRQRLAIARAALRDAPVVVLDEFTAHLDDRTEADLLVAMAELLRDRTALVIAHRPRTVALADRVVRLVDGAVR